WHSDSLRPSGRRGSTAGVAEAAIAFPAKHRGFRRSYGPRRGIARLRPPPPPPCYPSPMEPLATLYRWSDRMRDRARTRTFLRCLWRGFLDDRLFESAGALSFTMVFAMVPLSMVVFGVLSAFPVFDKWSDALSSYIFSNFVPASASAIEGYLRDFSRNTGQLTAVGVIALVVSLLVTLISIEATFNKIWRVKTARPQFGRFLVYWTVLTLGALVATASLALSTQFFALGIFKTASGQWLEAMILKLTPMVIELMAFTAIYRVVPHRTVQWRHAIAGAA